MDTVFANKDSALPVGLIVGGNYLDPDEGVPIKYTIYGNDFQPISGYEDRIVEVPSEDLESHSFIINGDSSFSGGLIYDEITEDDPEGEDGDPERSYYKYPNHFVLNIPAEVNSLSPGARYETRTVVISFMNMAKQYFLKYTYRVSEFPSYRASNDDVRLVFGLNDSDLADDLIDLDSCYFDLIQQYPDMEVMFKSGGLQASKANRILTLTCALKYANGLRLLAAGSESDGTSKMVRFEKGLDFDKQIDGAKAELEALMDEVLGKELPSVNLFMVGTTSDIFTGA